MFTKTEVGNSDPPASLVQNHIAKFEITMNYVFLKEYNHVAKFEITMNYVFLKEYNHIAKFGFTMNYVFFERIQPYC